MIQIRKSADRGGGAHGWLNSRHTKFMGFRTLRVINENKIELIVTCTSYTLLQAMLCIAIRQEKVKEVHVTN